MTFAHSLYFFDTTTLRELKSKIESWISYVHVCKVALVMVDARMGVLEEKKTRITLVLSNYFLHA